MKTIDAMKLALELIELQQTLINAVPMDTPLPSMPGFDGDWANGCVASIREAIAAKEAQTVEPIIWLPLNGDVKNYRGEVLLKSEDGGFRLSHSNWVGSGESYCGSTKTTNKAYLDTLELGYTHWLPLSAIPVTTNQVSATEPAKPTGEREALIMELRSVVPHDGNNFRVAAMRKAADMLAADADLLTQLARRTVERDMAISIAVCPDTRQVAVPKGWKLVPIKPTHEMLQTWKDSNIPSCSYDFEDYGDQLDWEHGYEYAAILDAAPQPTQAEQQAAVPMTPAEVDSMLIKLDSDNHCCNGYWPKRLIRAVEAHYGIVAKP